MDPLVLMSRRLRRNNEGGNRSRYHGVPSSSGVPSSDESDDWDDSCPVCGLDGKLVCCDSCPGGEY